MATAQPLDALGPQALAFLYKDLKDNRQVPASFIALLERLVGANAACNIDDFMKVVNKTEGIVIRCYRKLAKLLPGKFVKTELLDKDIRQNQAGIANVLRDFLLWNQGIPVNTGEDASTPTPVANTPPVPSGLMMVNGRLVQTVRSGPMVKKAEPVQRSPVAAPAPVLKPQVSVTSAEAASADKRIQVVKIQPSQLWKNSSLPTKALSGSVDLTEDPLAQPVKGKDRKRTAVPSEQSESQAKRMMTDYEIIDLLLEDPFDGLDQTMSAVEFGQTFMEMSSSSPAIKSPQQPAATPKGSAPSNKSAAGSKSSAKQQQQHQATTSVTNAAKKAQSAHEIALNQHAAHLAMATDTDISYAKQVLTECGGNISEATRKLQQYVVDLEEARIMDQARLASESTAVNDKMRAQADRERRLATSQAMTEFADSELLKEMQLVKTFLSRNESALTSDGMKLRRSIVAILEEEKKAIKWYKDSARAYMRQLPSRLQLAKTPTEFFQQELVALKDILYSTASEKGAPTAFLAALDAETAKVVRPGQVLGVSKDTPVELI